jgi:hypothetical protein
LGDHVSVESAGDARISYNIVDVIPVRSEKSDTFASFALSLDDLRLAPLDQNIYRLAQ